MSSIQATSNNDIYVGFWTNWSYGSVRGATLTLTNRDGGLLTAFLALFVTIAGTCFWRIACFTIHQALSSATAQDGIYHQRQAILRNAANGTSGLWSLLQINWVWRKHNRTSRRILPLIAFTLITLSTFIVAGIFSSQITTSMGNEVLLSGQDCGLLDLGSISATGVPLISVQFAISYMSYAKTCYRNATRTRGRFQSCPTLVQKSLSWTTKRDVSCPFPGGDKICLSNSTNLRLDTGYINSHSHLGINSQSKDRFLYRAVVECAPLKSEGYSENVTTYIYQNGSRSKSFMRYYYRPRTGPNFDREMPMTYQFPADPPSSDGRPTAAADYSIYNAWTYASLESNDPRNSFIPIPDLQRPGADIALFFLSANQVVFRNKSDDSWYSAHVPRQPYPNPIGPSATSVNRTVYLRDDPVRILGCVSQYQYCNPNLDLISGCAPLTGRHGAAALADGLWQTEKQKALFNWFASAIRDAGIGLEAVGGLGVSALQSRNNFAWGIQGRLPRNQWQVEMEYWFRITLARLQWLIIEVANGPADINSPFVRRPQTAEERLLCRSQKIRDDAFTSSSVLGLIILLLEVSKL